MKTFHQFNEDIAKRRLQLRQRQKQQMQAHKEKVASYAASQREKIEAHGEREALKNEIKRELKNER